MVHVVFLNRNTRGKLSIRTGGKLDLYSAIQHQGALRQRLIGFNFNFGFRTLHRAKIPTGVLHLVFHAQERRIVVRHLNILDSWQIHYREPVAIRFHAARFHVILDIFRHAGKQKFVVRRMRFRQHGSFFPFGRAGIFREYAHLGGSEPIQSGGNGLITPAANPMRTRFHADTVNGLTFRARHTSPQQSRSIA